MVFPLLASLIPVAAKAIGGLLGGNKSEDTQNQQSAQQPPSPQQQQRDQLLMGLLNGQISPQQARAQMGMYS